MSRCSKKCNEIKRRIDNISGLDSDIVYEWLERLENITDSFVRIIENHADSSETNGTCFEQDKEIDIDKIEEYKEYAIENATCDEDMKGLARKCNDLIKAVKQLNKKIK